MFYQPVHVLLIAVAAALVLPEPARWNPFTLARRGARFLAADLPKDGPWAAPAGILVLLPVAAAAAAMAWALTYALPLATGMIRADAMPVAALVLAAAMLRVTFRLPTAWQWHTSSTRPGLARWPSGGAAALHELAAGFAAPVLLFAFLGLYAAVTYRVALEIARALDEGSGAEKLGAPAAWLAYLVAAPAHRLVMLFAAVAARKESGSAPAFAVLGGTIALALLVTIW